MDELADVTAEYARYSSARGGLAFSAAGLWFVATFAIALRSQTWGRIAGIWAPVVVLGFIAVGKHRYQRRGTVIAASEAERRNGPSVWLVTFIMASVMVNALLRATAWMEGAGAVAELGILLGIATTPAVPVLVQRLTRGLMDGGVAFLAVTTMFWVTSSGGGWILARVMLALIAAIGAGLVGAGIFEHVTYRRLERRLAALRSPGA